MSLSKQDDNFSLQFTLIAVGANTIQTVCATVSNLIVSFVNVRSIF